MAETDDDAFDLDGPPPPVARGTAARAVPRSEPSSGSPTGPFGKRVAHPRSLLVVGGLLVAAVAASVLLRDPAPEPVPAPQQLLRVLTTAPDEDDDLAEVGVGLPAVLAGSTRGIARTPDARYWTGLDSEGGICLLVLIDRVVPGYGASCVEPADFAVRGVAMQTSVGGVVSDAVLVPDGYDTRELEADGMVRTGPNLLTRPSRP